MRPFLPKATYRNTTEALNLARVIHRNSIQYAPKRLMQSAMSLDCSTRTGRLKKAVCVDALRAVDNLIAPATLGVAAAACVTGGYSLLGYATTILSGTGADFPPEFLEGERANPEDLYANSREEGGPTPQRTEELLAQLNSGCRFGLFGQPERIAGERAEAAYDAGRGLAHAAWTGLAVGLNALLWVPRTASAVLHDVTVLTCALIGASFGAARFFCNMSAPREEDATPTTPRSPRVDTCSKPSNSDTQAKAVSDQRPAIAPECSSDPAFA